ncbi:MAG: amino acid-binding protein [Lachnospiraceae bacterium]|jgi:hypothetical protein|nr:amino acid-binding protein [Lachnospiraceae bacterium]
MKQLSVFIENREGRLFDVLRILGENDINIISLSLADTNDYGMLRMIVSKPQVALSILRDCGLSATLTQILAIKLPHESGSLGRALAAINDAGINIEYMYGLCADGDEAVLAIKTSDVAQAAKLLKRAGIEQWQM